MKSDSNGENTPFDVTAVAWWKNRRRLFWFALGIAILGAPSAGWVWWSSINFRVPASWVSGNFMLEHPKIAQTIDQFRLKSVYEKQRSGTESLIRAHSLWESPDGRLRVEFGEDGRFRWKKFDPVAARLDADASAVVLKASEGRKFRLLPFSETMWNRPPTPFAICSPPAFAAGRMVPTLTLAFEGATEIQVQLIEDRSGLRMSILGDESKPFNAFLDLRRVSPEEAKSQ
ncbi:MAG: hypothetical protein KDM63_13295 [Verrucomicrobiae bacterium]|nr:hypothetical protein [Verrucomicrobiae bacterium]